MQNDDDDDDDVDDERILKDLLSSETQGEGHVEVKDTEKPWFVEHPTDVTVRVGQTLRCCLLYTSDAADE